MSCFPESTYAVYVDGELASDEVRHVEAHLVTCRGCRALVLALRDESTLIGDVLLDRRREVQRMGVREAAPARGLVIGLLPSLALVGLIVAVLGWLLELSAPASVRWLNPLNLKGSYEMAFDLIFWLRDRAPGLLELVAAVAVTASVSALLSFAVTAIFRRFAGPATLGFALIGLVSLPAPGNALRLIQEDEFRVSVGETIEDTLIVSSETLSIDGNVEGNVIVAAERVELRGVVRGNVFALAESLDVTGVIEGSLHCICERTKVTGSVSGDLAALNDRLELSHGGSVGRDVIVFTPGAIVEGSVGRDLFSWGDWTELRGSVGRDLNVRHRLTLLDGARVGGDLIYSGHPGEEPEIAPGAQIAGEMRAESHRHQLVRTIHQYREVGFYVRICVFAVAAFVVGLVLHALLPGIFDSRFETGVDFFRALGVGFLTFVAAPFGIFVAAVTVVGIPLALIALSVYLTTLYLALILVASLIGIAVTRSDASSPGRFGLSLLVGLLVLMALGSLPVVGILIRILVVLSGLGLLTQSAWSAWQNLPASTR